MVASALAESTLLPTSRPLRIVGGGDLVAEPRQTETEIVQDLLAELGYAASRRVLLLQVRQQYDSHFAELSQALTELNGSCLNVRANFSRLEKCETQIASYSGSKLSLVDMKVVEKIRAIHQVLIGELQEGISEGFQRLERVMEIIEDSQGTLSFTVAHALSPFERKRFRGGR